MPVNDLVCFSYSNNNLIDEGFNPIGIIIIQAYMLNKDWTLGITVIYIKAFLLYLRISKA